MMLLRVFAVFGVIAVLSRAARATFSLIRGGVDMFVARDLADVRRQRGDVTGMEEAAALRSKGRLTRQRAAVLLLFWIGLLIVPSLTPWTLHVYAAYAVLWLLPGGRVPVRMSGSVRGGVMRR